MKSKICLIRHGITEGNQRRLYYGHADIPLANEGVDELTRLAKAGIYPDGENADFYTSGLLRTEQTFFIIYGEKEHQQLEALKEINFGSFEMKSHEELKEQEDYQTWMDDKNGELAPPQGESITGFYERIAGGFEDLKNRHALKALSMRHKDEEALSVIVCHGGTIAAILESIYPDVKDNFYQWIPDPGHGYNLIIEDGKVVDKEEF